MKTLSKIFILSTLVIIATCVLSVQSISAAQNPNYPSPSQCNGADWNIGSPDGATCTTSVTTNGSGRAMEGDWKATSIFGAESRLKPDLASANQFCKQYTGESTSYATYGRMHRYCNGCDQNISWYNGSSWTTNVACAGTLNVQEITCAKSCAPVYCANGTTMTATEFNTAKTAGKIAITQTSSNSQTIYHVNNTTGCSAPLIASSYKVFIQPNNPGWLSTQQFLADSGLININANGNTDIAVSLASCMTQPDLWYQTAPHSFTSDTASGYAGYTIVYGGPMSTTSLCVNCTANSSKQCSGNSVYWYNSCGTKEDLFQACTSSQVCQNAQCVNITCSTNSQCGTNGYTGSPFCQNGDVYQNYKTYTCTNPGTANSACTNSDSAQLKTNCTTNQTCSNGSCNATPSIACSTNANCGTNSLTGNPFCQGNNVFTNQLTYYCNNPGTPQSFCSNSFIPQLTKACGTNKTCTNGDCVTQNIACGSNSDCGSNGLTGNAFCQDDKVYKNYITYSCNNAGTSQSFCSSSLTPQLTQTCSPTQNCVNGSCTGQNIACSTNSACGTNAYTGSPYCQNGDVYQNYRTYTCNNPGTASSACSDSTAPQLKSNCTGTQTCSNGVCVNQTITCSTNSQCGTNGYTGSPFCQDGDVYQNYKTYTCTNPGTANSACSDSTAPQLKTNCTSGQTCSNGSCTTVNVACSTNSQCGTNGYTGSPYCQNGDVYQNYRTYTCTNPGTANSACTDSTEPQLKSNCTGTQTCSNGSCGNTCAYHSYQQCSGNSVYWYDSCGTQQDLLQYCQYGCQNGCCIQQNVAVQTNSATNINNNQVTLNGYLSGANNNSSCSNYVWFQWGTSTSYGNETTHQLQNTTGSFNQNVTNISSNNTYHFRAVAQGCSSGLVYGQDMTFTAGSSYTGNLLTINKTVRNLSSGNSGWSNTTYASPSDILMFMITVQATSNQDVNNVFVRDNFPSTLIYKNQLVVSGSNNYNNYSGDITSGINLNTISAGQTVTITYQAQVAPAQNFSYGTSTVNNSVTVTSSGSGYNPTSNASVIVTRATVLGATSISTGLTNNFLVDSFFLPLMLSLLGLWMFRSGMFGGIESWVDNRKKKSNSYKAEKELNFRIAQIREAEKI